MMWRWICFIVLITLVMTSLSLCSVPPIISYQGKLMQPSGTAITDGTYSIQFAIYDVPAGGTALWSETNPSIQVKGGLFSTMMGSVVNLPANVFDSPNRFFGIKVGSDPEMTPRQQIASVAFAMRANEADSAKTVSDGAITADKLADGAVSAQKIVDATITASKLAPGVAIPPGTILMWSGAVNTIPEGWVLCDGYNDTPNLGSKFIVGVGGVDNYAVNDQGGLDKVKLTVAEMPSHSHSNWVVDMSAFSGNRADLCSGSDYNTGGTHKEVADHTGGDQPHENRPPYYALCFIMKLGY